MGRLAFNKKEGDFKLIDHQHLSNCWWFIKIFSNGDRQSNDTQELIKREILERFNGQLLPYRPHLESIAEIKELEKKDMIVTDSSKYQSFDIYLGNKWIGELKMF
jgi:hypothetical protein